MTSRSVTPTAALASVEGLVVVQLWLTETLLDRYGSTAPVEAFTVARPAWATRPTVVKVPPTNSRLPTRRRALTAGTPPASAGANEVTREPSDTRSSTRPTAAAPLTVVNLPPT